MQEFIRIYLLMGMLYVVWLLLVTGVFKTKKGYIDPYEGKIKSNTALFLGLVASHLVAGILWPLVIMWRVIEYEMLDQKVMFYEQQYKILNEELHALGIREKDEE
jgi:hypothetical protein